MGWKNGGFIIVLLSWSFFRRNCELPWSSKILQSTPSWKEIIRMVTDFSSQAHLDTILISFWVVDSCGYLESPGFNSSGSIVQSLVLAAMEGHVGCFLPPQLAKRISKNKVPLTEQNKDLVPFSIWNMWPGRSCTWILGQERDACAPVWKLSGRTIEGTRSDDGFVERYIASSGAREPRNVWFPFWQNAPERTWKTQICWVYIR